MEEDSGEPALRLTFNDDGNRPAQTLATMGEILAFYQARCFFGLLFDLYALSKREFHLGIYLESHDNKSAIVSTRNLLSELKEIEDCEKSLSDDAKTAKFISFDSSIQATENLTVLLQSLVVDRSETGGENRPSPPKDLWDMQIVTESVAMLRETLVSASRQIYMPATILPETKVFFGRELPPAPENLLCRDRFKNAGWCPWYAAEAEELSLKSRSILFALSSIDRNDSRRTGQSHNRCSIEGCVWDNIDDTYQTRHVPNCESGEACPMVPAEDSQSKSQNASKIIANIVREGNIPAINIVYKADSAPVLGIKGYRLGQREGPNLRKRKRTRLEAGNFELGQKPYTEKVTKLYNHAVPSKRTSKRKHDEGEEESSTSYAMMRLLEERRAVGAKDRAEHCLPYIAISHVWSQGLGNRHNNTIWLCQLQRLQQYANHLVPPTHRPVPMWIDTICVPLEPDARMEAIKSMDAVYQNALAVLVVDQTLIDFDLSSAIAKSKEEGHGTRSGLEGWQIEMLMRIKASPWAQRLWTYNEAFLAQQLFFQVGYKGQSGLPGIWSQDILTPPTGDSVAHMFVPGTDIDDEDEKVVTAATRNTPTEAREGAPPNDVEKQSSPNVPRSEHGAFPLEYTAGYLLTEAASLQLFGGKYGSSAYRSQIPDFYEDLRYLSRQLAMRTTSHPYDEAICLSTLLGLGPEKVLFDTEDRKIAPENRMKTLWQVLSPERIPAEVLFCNRPIYGGKGLGWMPKNLSRDKCGNWINHLGCKDILRKDPEHGILVQMGGLRFEIPGTTGRGAEPDADLSLWNVVLHLSGFKYRILAVEASESWPTWRLSTHHRKFAILMPPSELELLFNDTEDRIEGSGSHSTELPFGLLVHITEEPQPGNAFAVDPASSLASNSDTDVFHVVRREMVELEVILDEEGSCDGAASGITVEEATEAGTQSEVNCDFEDERGSSQSGMHPGQLLLPDIFPERQKWWVG